MIKESKYVNNLYFCAYPQIYLTHQLPALQIPSFINCVMISPQQNQDLRQCAVVLFLLVVYPVG